MKKPVVVTVAVYKPGLSGAELAFLRNNLNKLASYDWAVVAPDGMDLTGIETEFAGVRHFVKTFDPKYFSSVPAYNRLCFSSAFY